MVWKCFAFPHHVPCGCLGVPRAGLEPARTFVHGPSNRRVYLFRHRGSFGLHYYKNTFQGPAKLGRRSMPQRFGHDHPTIVLFAIMAASMAAILLFTLWDVALEPSQRAALVAATVLVAAVSAWLITRD